MLRETWHDQNIWSRIALNTESNFISRQVNYFKCKSLDTSFSNGAAILITVVVLGNTT